MTPLSFVWALGLAGTATGFGSQGSARLSVHGRSSTALYAGDIAVSLEKPLGLVLAENEANAAKGLYIAEILPSGSGYANPSIVEKLQLESVSGVDCSAMGFDPIMELIASAASPVALTFSSTSCMIKVVSPKGTTYMSAEKGSNLRLSLQENKAPLYDFKGTMLNCNGGGQCGTCAIVVEEGDFGERSEWEDGKLKGKPANARLACQTLVDGSSATVVLQPKM